MMNRFILLSFGLLGWMFYVMSGGSDFDAAAIRAERLAAAEAAAPAVKGSAVAEAAKAAPAKQPPAVLIADVPKVVVDTSPQSNAEVSRMSLNLTSMDSAAAPRPDRAVAAQVPQTPAVVTSSADTPAIIPSLINPNDGFVQTPAAADTGAEDIRTVSGNRVNVRDGPGTDFGVVMRLRRGDVVRVVQDDGNGWVRLEPVDGGPGGWMADFLLENG